MLGIFDFQTLGWTDAVGRVGLALLFGFCLGLDRDMKNKPVDFRVFMIVASAACLLAIMGQELVATAADTGDHIKMDVMRVIEGVMTGIGFLGAGAIIKSADDKRIIGTATGASIWSAGAIGMLLGFGFYGLAILGFVALLIILVVFGYLRKPLVDQSDKY